MTSDLSTSFGDKTANYTRYRPAYDDAIFSFLSGNLAAQRRWAVELGAGSGQATGQIAQMFENVIAVEPDQRLVEQAQFPPNVSARVCAAEDAAFDANSVDAVLIATAFHWMDQQLICERATQWLAPGGVFFPFAYDVFEFEGGVQDYFLREFEKWRPYRDARLDDNYDYPAILEQSGYFERVTPFRTSTTIELATADAAGLICTASYAAAYARATSSPETYFKEVLGKLLEFGACTKITFPIIAAAGRVR